MNPLDALRRTLSNKPELLFAVLVGSRADGTAHEDSDWDIAVLWTESSDWMATVRAHESLRREMALALGLSENRIDLIDLSRANLVMRASVAENGVVLKGDESLEWMRFLTRTWRELEDFYWEQTHAA